MGKRIPAKQVVRAGTESDLREKLIDRELGFCDTDKSLYIMRDGVLHPISRVFTAVYGVTTRVQIQEAIDAGALVVLRGLSIYGNTMDVYMVLSSVQKSGSGYDTYTFGSALDVQGDNAVFYWAKLTGSSWSNGARTVTGSPV